MKPRIKPVDQYDVEPAALLGVKTHEDRAASAMIMSESKWALTRRRLLESWCAGMRLCGHWTVRQKVTCISHTRATLERFCRHDD
jgi:hypothetical protein